MPLQWREKDSHLLWDVNYQPAIQLPPLQRVSELIASLNISAVLPLSLRPTPTLFRLPISLLTSSFSTYKTSKLITQTQQSFYIYHNTFLTTLLIYLHSPTCASLPLFVLNKLFQRDFNKSPEQPQMPPSLYTILTDPSPSSSYSVKRKPIHQAQVLIVFPFEPPPPPQPSPWRKRSLDRPVNVILYMHPGLLSKMGRDSVGGGGGSTYLTPHDRKLSKL